MPSKNNKKKAAAERSAKLAAEAGSPVPDQKEVVPAVAQATPAARAPDVIPPTAEMAAVTVTAISSTSDSSTTSSFDGPKKHIPYDLPAKLQPLQKNNPLRITTNSFQMEVSPTACFRFDVSVQKQQNDEERFELAGQRGGNRNRQSDLGEIVAQAFKQVGLDGSLYLYDGAATLYTTKKLETKKSGVAGSILTTVDASFSPNIKRSYFDRDTRGVFHVVIEPNTAQPKLLTTDILKESLNSTSCPLTQMMQIAVGEAAKRDGFLVTDGGKELFDREGVQSRKGIEEMRGVGATVKIAVGASGNGAAHLIIDYKRKRFFTAGPLENLDINWNDYSKAGQYVKGIAMATTYSRQTIEAIGVSNIPMVEIRHPHGTVLADAAANMGRNERTFNRRWPAIQARVGRRVLSFAIESLLVLPNQKLNPKQGDPPRCEQPFRRFEMMEAVGKKAKLLSPNAILKEFGVRIIDTPIMAEAVKISLPSIVYNNYVTTPNIAKQAKWEAPNSGSRGTFNIRANIPKMLLLFNSESEADQNKLVEIKASLERTARDLGVTIGEIRIENLARTYGNLSAEEALEAKYKSIKKSSIYVMYADYSQQPTHQLLKLLERLYEVPTQHVTFDKAINKAGKSTLTNFMLKINAKSVELNHKVTPDPMTEHLWGDKSNTLFISYDVCHSSGKVYKKGEKCTEPSCVGFGYNGTAVPEAIIGDFHYQLPRHEEVDADLLKLRAKLMTQTYLATRKKVPQNVIILRDGVSEGQNAMVRLNEYPAIRAGVMEAIQPSKDAARKNGTVLKDPAFAILIVLKNNAHRLYLKNGTNINNVPPMTAIDDKIVKNTGVEMVMVCHHPLNGTAQPVLINMLLNENVFKKNDEIVRLMATMCCAHQVSTTVTSVPEPIAAADDYAKRGSDLFNVLNKRTPAEVPRKTDEEGIPQIDFDALTQKLSYFFSVFKLRRVA